MIIGGAGRPYSTGGTGGHVRRNTQPAPQTQKEGEKMLSLEQIMELQDKGFTYEQMQILNNMNLTAPAEPKPEPPAELPAESKPEPPAPAEPEQDATVELNKKIDELTATVKAMQAQNVKQAEQDAPKTLTADDVIKSFMEAS